MTSVRTWTIQEWGRKCVRDVHDEEGTYLRICAEPLSEHRPGGKAEECPDFDSWSQHRRSPDPMRLKESAEIVAAALREVAVAIREVKLRCAKCEGKGRVPKALGLSGTDECSVCDGRGF